MVIISDLSDPHLKKLSETKGQVISDYQGHLEDEWIKTLKRKYPIKVDDKVLQSMITK